MIIHKAKGQIDIDSAMQNGEPMLAVISFDGKNAYLGHIDECVEHNILLNKVGLPEMDIDKYFRIIFSDDGADWTFICPSDYKNISDRTHRIATFYRDGFVVISDFLAELGFYVELRIPKRYRRHIDALQDS